MDPEGPWRLNLDTHVFGSQRGYECLAKSPGVAKSEDDALSQFGFGQSSDEGFLDGLARDPTALGRVLPTGRYALTRVLCGKPDVAGRATLEFRTLIFSQEDFLTARTALPGLVINLRLWQAGQFGAGTALEIAANQAPQSPPTEWSWRIFDAWFSMQAMRPHCILIEPELAGEVLRMPALLDPTDARSFSWGIGLLRPLAWVDATVLSPFGTPGTSRPAFGISRGQCVNPRIESARLANPGQLPSHTSIVVGGPMTVGSDEAGPTRGRGGTRGTSVFRPAKPANPRQTAVIWAVAAVAGIALLVGGVFIATKLATAVPAPANVKAADKEDCEYVDVSWDPVEGATAYRVTRVESKVENGVKMERERKTWHQDAQTLKYQDKDAKPGLNYEYSVQAFRDKRESRPSAADEGSLANQPSAPVDLVPTVDVTSGKVKLSWKPGPPIDGKSPTDYTVIRSAAGTPPEEFRVGAPEAQWTDETGSAAVKYTYSVRAETDVGPSRASKSEGGVRRLERVATVTVDTASSANYITVSWSAVDGATGYEVIRTPEGGKPSGKPRPIPKETLKHHDIDAVPWIEYEYSVVAKAPGADSLPSDPALGVRPLDPPKGLKATRDRVGEVVLSWTLPGAAPHIDHYIVTRIEQISGIKFKLPVPMGSTVSCTDKTAQAGVEYTYTIRAVTAAGGASVESDSEIGMAALGTSALWVTKDLADVVRITWTPLPDKTRIEITRKAKRGNSAATPFDVDGAAGMYEDTTANPGTTYEYTYRIKDPSGSLGPPSPASVGSRLLPILDKTLGDELKQFVIEVKTAGIDVAKKLEALRLAWDDWDKAVAVAIGPPQPVPGVSLADTTALLSADAEAKLTACETAVKEVETLHRDLEKFVKAGSKAINDYKKAPGDLVADRLAALVKVTAVRHLAEQCTTHMLTKAQWEKLGSQLKLRGRKVPKLQLGGIDEFGAKIDSKPSNGCLACITLEAFDRCWTAELGNRAPDEKSGKSTTEVHDLVKDLLTPPPP